MRGRRRSSSRRSASDCRCGVVEALVLGSGAAGLRAAVELKRRDVDVAIATQSAFGGTSACSGSDKQTLHTANGADRGDDFRAMADALGAGGAMDEDTAYVEAVGSARALASLQFLGLPIPQDRLGGVLRYQTDHDEVGRATSCGPRTSRLMVQVLAREAIRLDIPIFNHTTGVRLLVAPRPPVVQPASWRCARSSGPTDNPLGLAVFLCNSRRHRHRRPWRTLSRQRLSQALLRLARPRARGGPRSRQPDREPVRHRHVRADGFPWNLSGTYVQCDALCVLARLSRARAQLSRRLLPDDAGAGLEHLPERLSVAVPCDAHARLRLEPVRPRSVPGDAGGTKSVHGFQSQSARRPGRRGFRSRTRWIRDVRAYLENTGALLEKPIDRLRKMNPLSIELYKRYKYDITQRSARIRDQQPAHERRPRGRHLGRDEPRGLLRGRRSGRNPWRHPSGRRGAQCRPGLRHALRRTISPRGQTRRKPRTRRNATSSKALSANPSTSFEPTARSKPRPSGTKFRPA